MIDWLGVMGMMLSDTPLCTLSGERERHFSAFLARQRNIFILCAVKGLLVCLFVWFGLVSVGREGIKKHLPA